ncbi:MAG: heavy-metal-associated domain-containing protein [Desulfovibrio sp.]|nr:heavy-metal-associated domain-containing protein [Desulfovibrio sp.]
MPSLQVDGMHCENCKNAVEKTVKAIPGVKDAKVDLNAKELHWEEVDKEKPIALDIIMGAIEDLGYKPNVKP